MSSPICSVGTVPKRVSAPSASHGGSATGPDVYQPRGGYQKVNLKEAAERDAVLIGPCDWCGEGHSSTIIFSRHCIRGKSDCEVRTRQLEFRRNNDGRSLTLCEYTYCENPTSHLIVMCPFLNNRCTACGFRGHQPLKGRCDDGQVAELTRLRTEFERVADYGAYTNRRHYNLKFGFYPAKDVDVSCLNGASYADLINMPVLVAYAMIEPRLAAVLASKQTT